MISIKDFFSFSKNKAFWLNLAAMILLVVGVCIAALYWLDSYTLHNQAVIVPTLKGENTSQAAAMLHKQGLKAVVIDSSYVKGVAADLVLDQNPAAGAKVKNGRTIYLTISTSNVPMVALPDIVDNSSLRQASARLRALGFVVESPVLMAGEKDWIYKVTLEGRELHSGERIPRESHLTLHVGNGMEAIPNDSIDIELNTEEKAEVDSSWF